MRHLFRFLLSVALMVALTSDADARVYASISMGGAPVQVFGAASALKCNPRETVWTTVGYMCPESYRIWRQTHPSLPSYRVALDQRRGYYGRAAARHPADRFGRF